MILRLYTGDNCRHLAPILIPSIRTQIFTEVILLIRQIFQLSTLLKMASENLKVIRIRLKENFSILFNVQTTLKTYFSIFFISTVLSSFQPSNAGDHSKPAYKHSSSKIVEGLSHPLRYLNMEWDEI